MGRSPPDERTGLSFNFAAGPRQCSHFRVRQLNYNSFITSGRTEYKSPCLTVSSVTVFSVFIHCHRNVFTQPMFSNGLPRMFIAAGMCVGEPLASNELPL
jgi:hypothetical protein